MQTGHAASARTAGAVTPPRAGHALQGTAGPAADPADSAEPGQPAVPADPAAEPAVTTTATTTRLVTEPATTPAVVRPTVRTAAKALLRACHPEPTIAVTAVATALAATLGRGAAGTLAVALAVLTGQLSVGWHNDYLDRDRDVRVGRTDKPVVRGAVRPTTVRNAAGVAVAATVPLSLLSGIAPGLLHVAAVVSAWTYNLWLKNTPASVLPYTVSFGLLPAFVVAGSPGHPVPPVWLVAAGALLGSGAHFANVLPDLADDVHTGIRGLPHRLGADGSRAAAALLLVAASVVLAVGPPGRPGALGVAGLVATAVAVAVVMAGGMSRGGARADTRWPFLAVLVLALVDVGLLIAAGQGIT